MIITPPPPFDRSLIRRFLRRDFTRELVAFTVTGCPRHRTEAGKAIFRLIALDEALRKLEREPEIERLLARCRAIDAMNARAGD